MMRIHLKTLKPVDGALSGSIGLASGIGLPSSGGRLPSALFGFGQKPKFMGFLLKKTTH
jgi:hypothetical protein